MNSTCLNQERQQGQRKGLIIEERDEREKRENERDLCELIMPSPLIRNNKQDENEISSFSSTITRVQLLGWVTVYKKKMQQGKCSKAGQGKARQRKAKTAMHQQIYMCMQLCISMMSLKFFQSFRVSRVGPIYNSLKNSLLVNREVR